MRPSQLLLLFSTLVLGNPLTRAPAANNQIPLVSPTAKSSALDNVAAALATLQDEFFSPAIGTYPSGIDWTRAVTGTLLAASTTSLSAHESHRALSTHYFSQLIALFYGQHTAAMKRQAFDDILWVVLQWLEAAKTIDVRTTTFPASAWAGAEWRAPFAQRALEFYTLAETGWDTRLCGGGMVWSPWLEPYKNAVTNQLFIAASVAMFLHHPAHNSTHLANARAAHRWLAASGMQNAHGLYTDGFHVSRLRAPPDAGEKQCDVRNEMVYTYNQGVLLSGLRGLAEATGERAYLEEGFALVDAVVSSQGAVGEVVRARVLTEKCDPAARCSQDGQTFKAVWMHHFTRFCEPLVWAVETEQAEVVEWHASGCREYWGFVSGNAVAAWSTRNAAGVVGSWWGADAGGAKETGVMDEGAVDYRNEGQVGGEGAAKGDLNDRGRGRTVESHTGGLAALRAVLEVVVG